MIELDKNLISFCETERQKEIFECVARLRSAKLASAELNCNKRWVERTICNIKRRAALKGYSPEHDMTKVCPDPYIVKGVSTLYDKEGKPVSQWVKTTIDEDKLNEYIEGIIEASLSSIKPVKVKQCQIKNGDPDTLTVYPVADLHIGMKAWKNETGNDYDLEIIETILKKVFTKLIERSPNTKSCLLLNLGDLLHTDNLQNETSRNRNTLDVDTRYAKIYGVAMKLYRFMIETAATKHQHVYVINCMGNHDDIGSLAMGVALDNIYSKNKRIHILNSPAPRQYFKFGDNLIGATHGYDCSGKDLALVMASERPEEWGATRFHYWATGHIHSDKVIEAGKCKIESFRTLAAKDAWTNAKGFLSGNDLKSLVFHKKYGEIERYTISADPELYQD